jgi:hypothetical protein
MKRGKRTIEALRRRAAMVSRMAFDCCDASIRDELRRLAQEFLTCAEELEASKT